MSSRAHRLLASAGGVGATVATAVATLLAAGCGATDQGSIETFCDRAPRIEVVSTFEELVGPGGGKRVAEVVTALAELAEVAPPEIRAEVTTMAEVSADLRDALAAERGDDEAARATTKDELTEGLERFGDASESVVAYTRKTCGVNLNET
jgi:hypothetical protein